jgi:hypothetical protein
MDRFGIDHFATFEERCDLVVELCRRHGSWPDSPQD